MEQNSGNVRKFLRNLPIQDLPKEQIIKAENEWFRASGDCICTVCGEKYNRHQCYEFSEIFHLNLLCTGEFVKL